MKYFTWTDRPCRGDKYQADVCQEHGMLFGHHRIVLGGLIVKGHYTPYTDEEIEKAFRAGWNVEFTVCERHAHEKCPCGRGMSVVECPFCEPATVILKDCPPERCQFCEEEL